MTQKPSGLNRRKFLQAVGVSGGAGTMFATMGALGLAPTASAAPRADSFTPPSESDFHLSGRASKKVVILGGGIAGLASAYELGKAGYDCTILEARDRTGGRNFTARDGDTQTQLDGTTQTSSFGTGNYMNVGPARLPQWMVTLDYCRELGVEIQPFANQNADAYIYNENSGFTPGNPTRYRTAKADVYGYVSELLSKATNAGALDGDLTADDKAKLLTFLKSYGQLQSDYSYKGGSNRGYASYPTAWDDTGTLLGTPPPLSDVFASQVGKYFSFEFEYDMAMMMFQPVGGMDMIPKALTRAIGAQKIELGAVVSSIQDTVDGATVTYTDAHGKARQIEADFCIAAMPPHIMARMQHNLGDAVTAALGKYKGTPVGKIGLEYDNRWWENERRIYGGITETDMDISHIWYPSYGFHSKSGVVLGYYNTGTNATTYGAMAPADRLARALDQGAKIHGDVYKKGIKSSFSQAWHLIPHIEGGWTSPPIGTPEYELLQQPAGPNGQHVYFAGDWLSELVAWQHGAFWSARDTVTALHMRVMKS
ncbi:MAG: FAD-dependent oxidoreductase [Nocardioides sp.]|nr:FAD-dependent oxidoreductase [Nocardioides sp.]